MFAKWAVCALILVLLVESISSKRVSLKDKNKAKKIHSAAVKTYMDKNYQEARQLFKESLDLNPEQPRGWMNYLALVRIMDKPDVALSFAKEALSYRSVKKMAHEIFLIFPHLMTDDDIVKAEKYLKQREKISLKDKIKPKQYVKEMCLRRVLADKLRHRNPAQSWKHATIVNDHVMTHRTDIDPKKDAVNFQMISTLWSAERIQVASNALGQDQGVNGPFFSRAMQQFTDKPTPIVMATIARSGSTLFEKIFSNSEFVQGVGEPPWLYQFFRVHANEPLESIDWDKYRAQYYKAQDETLQSMYGTGTPAANPKFALSVAVVFPFYWYYLTLLPNAKILDYRRNVLDVALSNYLHHYTFIAKANGYQHAYDVLNFQQPWCYSTEGIVSMIYAHYAHIRHFESLFEIPGLEWMRDRVLKVQYEDLVREPETQIQRVLDFLGVEEDSAQVIQRFNSDDAAHFADTPSNAAIKNSINTKAIGGWKKFEKEMQPIIQGIRKLYQETGWPEFDVDRIMREHGPDNPTPHHDEL